jgi:hypothetical protein
MGAEEAVHSVPATLLGLPVIWWIWIGFTLWLVNDAVKLLKHEYSSAAASECQRLYGEQQREPATNWHDRLADVMGVCRLALNSHVVSRTLWYVGVEAYEKAYAVFIIIGGELGWFHGHSYTILGVDAFIWLVAGFVLWIMLDAVKLIHHDYSMAVINECKLVHAEKGNVLAHLRDKVADALGVCRANLNMKSVVDAVLKVVSEGYEKTLACGLIIMASAGML